MITRRYKGRLIRVKVVAGGFEFEGELYLEHQSLLATAMELTTLNGELVDHAEVGKVLANFDDLWQALALREQSRVLERLVERFESQWHV